MAFQYILSRITSEALSRRGCLDKKYSRIPNISSYTVGLGGNKASSFFFASISALEIQIVFIYIYIYSWQRYKHSNNHRLKARFAFNNFSRQISEYYANQMENPCA